MIGAPLNPRSYEFARTSSETREVTLRTVDVRVTHPGHPEADKDGDADLHLLTLTTKRPVATPRDIRIRINDAAEECRKGCALFIGAYYSVRTSPELITSSGVGEFVDVNLASRTAQLRAPKKIVATGAALEASTDRCPFTPAQASEALGQSMTYRPPGYDCVMVPAAESSAFSISVMRNVNTYDRIAIASDAQPLSLGDRSIWLPGVAMGYVQRGPWTIAVQIGENQTPAPPTIETRTKAETIAGKLLKKL